MRNDFYVGMYEDQYLAHSFKGTFWKKGHKYLKRIGNVYYYAKKANEFDYERSEDQKAADANIKWYGSWGVRSKSPNLVGKNYAKIKRDYIQSSNSAAKNKRLSNTYSNMATTEAQKLFGEKAGKVFAGAMKLVAKPKKKYKKKRKYNYFYRDDV